jgi:hypothetical protein
MIVVQGQINNFSVILWWEEANFQWDDDVYFVVEQHSKLDFYSARSLK